MLSTWWFGARDNIYGVLNVLLDVLLDVLMDVLLDVLSDVLLDVQLDVPISSVALGSCQSRPETRGWV